MTKGINLIINGYKDALYFTTIAPFRRDGYILKIQIYLIVIIYVLFANPKNGMDVAFVTDTY